MELCDYSANQIVQLIHNREISAQEALNSCLQRISDVDGQPGSLAPELANPEDSEKIHAFITVTSDMAQAQAKEIDRKIAQHEDPGPLAGVPFSVKDVFTINGTPTTAASRILANFSAPYTATSIVRMIEAGGLVLGKVNLDEFTFGSSCESSAFKPTPRNPWNMNRVPGGSSGGCTAAVAAGEGQLSIGTDTAGSIRQPASFCGVVGVKPTYGRVSRYGLIAFGSSLDCPGPVARDISDAALMLKVIAGQDPRDATAANVPVPDYPAFLGKSIKGMRIGLSPDYFRITFPDPETGEIQDAPIGHEIEAAVMHAAGKLADAGAEIIEDVPIPYVRYAIPSYFVISRVEGASNLHRYGGINFGYRAPEPVEDLREMYRKTRGQGFGLQPKLRILMGLYVSAAQYSEQYYHRALQIRSLIRQDFERAFDPTGQYRLNALLTPTTPTTAFPFGNVYGDSVLMQYADQLTVAANHAGIPAISLPGGLDSEGLPIGIQLIGADFREEVLFQIGFAYETVTADEPWRQIRPTALQR